MTETLVRNKRLGITNSSGRPINLLISGFGHQQLVPVDDVVAKVTQLPVKHIEKIQVIKYDPNKNISFLLRHQRVGPQLGEYLLGYNSIVIYRFTSRSECFHVLFHEIGHHVYFKSISSFKKKEWVTQVYRSENGVSELGQRNACEDFAEAYAFYLTNPEHLKSFPRKYAFIRTLFD
ncbi:hypothetical protein [Pleionea sediminis]|uniref:hypothetical protein n=1 Tax=Pleionea sediminis TaxID=2569479 RepID=UPI001186FB4B|nr:hypothetical protein [Pleionea sediminis]